MFGKVALGVPEMWLSKNPKMSTLRVAVAEPHARELGFDFTTFQSIFAQEDFQLPMFFLFSR